MYYQTMLFDGDVQICVNAILPNRSTVAVIIFPGLNLSKSGPFFLLSNVARHCAAVGFNTFQFDYYGDGDSSGSYEDIDVEHVRLSISLVKGFARKCGCNHFVYIGYGIGNVLISEISNDKDLIGICMIAPELYAYKRVENILKKTTSFGSEYIYNDKFLWPNTSDEQLKKYWISIIGIVDWLYYTPFNIEFLRQISKIDNDSFFSNNEIDMLILAPQSELGKILSPNKHIVNIESLNYRSKDDWEALCEWPDIWDGIAGKIQEWIRTLTTQETTDDSFCFENIDGNNSFSNYENKNSRSTRIPICFYSNGKKIFGILHMPSNAFINNQKFPCVIYEPGLGGSRVDMSRAGLWLGDTLAQNGFVCFRYDSIGSGVSEGEFYEITWEQRYHNLLDAIDFLDSTKYIDTSNVVIVSYSAGAKISCLAASKNLNIKGYIFWSPYLIDNPNVYSYTKLLLRKQGLVQPMCGLWLGFEFIKTDSKFDFFKMFKDLTIPALVITGSDYDKDINISPIIKECSNNNKQVIQFPGAHCFLYKYMNLVINETLKYINNIFRGGK